MSHYSQRKDLFPIQGGCTCGYIRYQLNLPPILVHCCHCKSCQRETGSAFGMNIIIESSAVDILPSLTADSRREGLAPGFARLTDSQPPAPAPATTGPPQPKLTAIPSESGVGVCVARCPVCRGALWNHYGDAGTALTYLRAGTLDEPGNIQPDVHIFTRTRRDFVTVSDGKPQFEAYYPDRKAFYRPDVLERVEALQPKQQKWRESLLGALKAGA